MVPNNFVYISWEEMLVKILNEVDKEIFLISFCSYICHTGTVTEMKNVYDTNWRAS
jgi:hypothetical protein